MTIRQIARRIATKASRRANRTRLDAAMSVARRAAVLNSFAGRVNASRGVIAVADYLTGLGADYDTRRRYASHLGTLVATAFRAKFHAEPAITGIAAVRRRLVDVFAYDLGDVEILRAATASYKNTSHLIGA